MQPGGGYEFLASESTVGVERKVATGTDAGVDTGMSMDMNQELTGMIEGINPDELTLEDESFIEELKVLVDKVGKDTVDSKILDFLNQSQMKLDELKKVQTPSNLADGEVKTLTYFEEDMVEIPFYTDHGSVTTFINTYLEKEYGLSENGNVRIKAYTDSSKSEFVYLEVKDTASWANSAYTFEWNKETVYGMEFDFRITLLEDLIIPEGYVLDIDNYKPTVTVTVPIKTITEVEPISVKTFVGSDFDLLGLPKKVKVIIDKTENTNVGVSWNEEDYDSTKLEKQIITGTLNGKGYEFDEGVNIEAEVTLVNSVNIDSFEKMDIEIKKGEEIQLPNVIVGYENGEKIIIPVTWNVSQDELVNLGAGKYEYYPVLPVGCTAEVPKLTLVIKEGLKLQPYEDRVDIELGEKPVLPEYLIGKNDAGEEVQIPVTWECDKEINQKGVYEFVANYGDTVYLIDEVAVIKVYVSSLASKYEISKETEYRETSDAVSVEATDSGYVITINPEADGDLVVDFVNINPGIDATPVAGDSAHQIIKIVNNSGKEYRFKNNSLQISTANEKIYGDELSSVMGFDKQYIPAKYVRTRFANAALYDLTWTELGKQFGENELSDKNLEWYLEMSGYIGKNALNNYYLDYYNDDRNNFDIDGIDAVSLEDLDEAAIKEILADTYNGDATATKETNPEVIALYYNWYYNKVLGIVFGDEPTRSETNGNDDSMMVGAYMRGSNYLDEANDYFSEKFGRLNIGEEENADLYYFVHFNYGDNGIQHTSYEARIAFELEEVPEEPTPTPDPDPTPDPRPEPEEPEEEIEEDPTPETGGEEEEIEDEETPEVGNKDDVTDTGVASTMPWLFGLVTSMGVAIAELFRRRQK